MGVYTIRGPRVPEVDAAVYRTFKIREWASLQARGEAFNIPNDFLRGNPSASITSPTLGSINTAGNPRIQNPDGFAPDLRNQPLLHGLFRHQSHLLSHDLKPWRGKNVVRSGPH